MRIPGMWAACRVCTMRTSSRDRTGPICHVCAEAIPHGEGDAGPMRSGSVSMLPTVEMRQVCGTKSEPRDTFSAARIA